MTLPVIANTYRITLLWSEYTVTPRNVFHVRASGSTTGEIGDLVQASFNSGQFSPMTDQVSLDAIEIIKLDGTSASAVVPLGTPVGGPSGGQIIPAQAAIVSFRTNVRGPRGRGRMYLGPVTEGSVSNGGVNSGNIDDMNEGWSTFVDTLEGSFPEIKLVVASYAHSQANDVTAFIVEQTLGTQRRRQDQLR